ncbi:MAG TPA: acetyl-CoA carboxylase biotin carboxylase subunit [Candidatus Eremiobacteraceae bacterium]
MFNKVLIANRGEIALRVIRACRELECKSVAIFSEADRNSLHVRFADEAFCVGPGPSARSYLNVPNIIGAAEVAGVDAIHPGYGFLSENAGFAEICASHGIKFIGPPASAIALMGDKASAKQRMLEAGVPVIPGSGIIDSLSVAKKFCAEVGYPVLIKATAGGGGKGMRIVGRDADLAAGLTAAGGEAQAAFGNAGVYIEKLLVRPRHIEVQVLADEYGHVIHVGERDCSVQKPSHQKLLEEAPAPNLDADLRVKLNEAAVRAARACGYANAGTLEFLVTEDGKYYFMEMNTRIQVEHPVTEVVYGVDLVKWQVRIAAGERLTRRQEDIRPRGHAIECRINAEDPDNKFTPAAGKLGSVLMPGGPGIRVDTHIYSGVEVPPYYDSLLAKITASGRDRADAIARMRRALFETEVRGLATTVGLHRRIMTTPSFLEGRTHVTWLREELLLPQAAAAGSHGG